MLLRYGYWLALLLALPAYWPRLVRSLWVDEAGTYWMAQRGFWGGMERAVEFTGQSILYAAVTSWFCLPEGPWMEFALRLPSVAGLGLMLYFIARLGRRVLGEAGGLCAFVFLLFHPMCLDIFSQARPYGLAAAAVVASYWFIHEWVEQRKWRWAAGYGLAVTLVWHLHFVYVAALGAQILYLAWVMLVERRRERWGQIAVALGASTVFIAPLFWHFMRATAVSRVISYEARPDIVDLAMTAVPLPMAGLALGLLVLAFPLFRQGGGPWPATAVLVQWAGWWWLGMLVLFVVSQGESFRLFVPRYLGSSAGAVALLLAAAWAKLLSPRLAAGGAMVVAVLLGGPVGWWMGNRPTGVEALPMITAVRGVTPEAPPPVFFQSSLVESNVFPWRKGVEGSYLFGELAAYPLQNRVYTLPVELDADASYYVKGILDTELAGTPVVVFVKGGELSPWVGREMEARGYRMELVRPNAYSVGIFRRNPVR